MTWNQRSRSDKSEVCITGQKVVLDVCGRITFVFLYKSMSVQALAFTKRFPIYQQTSIFYLTVRRRYIFCRSFVLLLSCVYHAFASVHCCLVVTCWERADLMALVCGLKLCFCWFPMWFPGSGVVLDCIDS